MTPQAALVELLERVSASQGAAVRINDDELSQWPCAAVAVMKTQQLLTRARPATSAICPGCERDCVMPVHVIPPEGKRSARAFVSCDKRDDVDRVSVDLRRLEQWQTTCELIAAVLAKLLGFSQPSVQVADGRQWHIGTFKGKKHHSPVNLLARDSLILALAGHIVPLVDVLTIEKNSIVLDKATLIRLVDNPSGKSETETSEVRRERIRARVREEKAKGTKPFLRVVAEEEGISPSRIKQLVKDDIPSKNDTLRNSPWADLAVNTKQTSSKKNKHKY